MTYPSHIIKFAYIKSFQKCKTSQNGTKPTTEKRAFYFIFVIIIIIIIIFRSGFTVMKEKERKGVDLAAWESGESLGGVREGKTNHNILYEKMIVN